jgi:hypothetical protein
VNAFGGTMDLGVIDPRKYSGQLSFLHVTSDSNYVRGYFSVCSKLS